MKKEDLTELIRYGMTGIMTTLINYLVFIACLSINSKRYMIANTLAWCVAVIFAYYTNKKYVFKKEGKDKKEFLSFVLMRFITLGIENLLLFLTINIFMIHVLISKILVSIVTILGNYVLCKFKIFQKEGELYHEKN